MAIIERIPKLNMRPKHLIKVYSVSSNGPFDAYNTDLSGLMANLGDPIGGV